MRSFAPLLAATAALLVGASAVPGKAEDAPASAYFQVDLSKHVNHSLYEAMLKTDGNDLSNLAGAATTETPRKTLKGVPFRLDGVILVGPGESSNGTTGEPVTVPKKVEGIPIGRKAERLYFLQATHWSAETGTKIGAYIIHYSDGSTVEIPIRYGEDILDWWSVPGRSNTVTDAQIAWTGTNDAATRSDPSSKIQLFLKTWKNPNPDREIKSLDLVSGDQKSGPGAPAPFLVALSGQ